MFGFTLWLNTYPLKEVYILTASAAVQPLKKIARIPHASCFHPKNLISRLRALFFCLQ